MSERKQVEFSPSKPSGLGAQRAAFAEAARIEMFAQSDATDHVEREPFSRLIEDGTAIGPILLSKQEERVAVARASEGDFPLDTSELGRGRSADIITPQRNKVGALTIHSITRREIRLSTSKSWTPPAGPHFLVKSGGNFAMAIYQKLMQPGPEWPPTHLPELTLGPIPPLLTEKGSNFLECLATCTGENGLSGIKGPPGTGKTHLLAWAATALAQQGKSVIIATTAHAAIETALIQTAEAAALYAPDTRIAKKLSKNEHLHPDLLRLGVKTLDTAGLKSHDLFQHHQIIGITLASLIRSDQMPLADFLFLDEAGQIPAFSACSVAGFARNMVLLGDENQLAPVLQGEHHDHLDCAHSAMAFLRKRIPQRTKTLRINHRANTLSVAYTQRHHYSDIELEAGTNKDARIEGATAQIDGMTLSLPTEGTHTLEIAHSNRKKHAPEESQAAAAIVMALLGKTLYLPGETRPLRGDDFAVLCPNKRQAENVRRILERTLPAGEPIPECGTVHKLQGQGRPVVIFCATASHTGYIENQAEFLFNRPLWNVATSRAKAVTFILGNKEAIATACPKTLAGIELKCKALETF